MFGFSSQTTTTTLAPHAAEDVVLRFEPYPAMSAPQPDGGWQVEDPVWANDVWGDEIDESDPQPGRDDHDFEDGNLNADLYIDER